MRAAVNSSFLQLIKFTKSQERAFSLSPGGKYTVSRETGNSFRGVVPNIPYYVTSDFERKFTSDRYQMHQVCVCDFVGASHQRPAAYMLWVHRFYSTNLTIYTLIDGTVGDGILP